MMRRNEIGNCRHQRGFTLVEAVIVIVITAAIAGVVAVFLRAPVQSYVDSAARAELTDVADLALRRMARDLRLALPNSVRVSADRRYLELLLTKTGGRYLAEEDNQGGPFLRFGATTPGTCGSPADYCQFMVVGAMPDPPLAVNDWIVIYNLGPGFDPADAYTLGNRARISGIAGNNVVTLDANPFATQDPPMRSPSSRFQVVTTPVTYFCDTTNGTLRRFWNYSIQTAQPVDAAAAPLSGTANAILANGVADCSFDYANVANVHSALIGLRLTLNVPNTNSGQVTLFHQVHVDNTP